MGICYRIVNVTKKEFIDVNKWPDDDNLQKLWLLLYLGHWTNCTVTICRDDSDSGPGLGPDAWGEMDDRVGWLDVDDAYEWEEPTSWWLSGRATGSLLQPRPTNNTELNQVVYESTDGSAEQHVVGPRHAFPENQVEDD